MRETTASPTLWVDVDDLYRYARHNPRPSGIQRVVFEIVSRMEQRAPLCATPCSIRFVRQGEDGNPLSLVTLSEIRTLFASMAPEREGWKPADTSVSKTRRSSRGFLRNLVIRALHDAPPDTGKQLLAICILQRRVFRLFRYLLKPSRRSKQVRKTERRSPDRQFSPVQPAACGRNDVFLVLGAPWSQPSFHERLRKIRERHGLRPLLLIHDLVPFRRPEWCHPDLVRDFRHWLETSLPQCPDLLAISHATARDLTRYASQASLKLSSPIEIMPMGPGLDPHQASPVPCPGLPPTGSYVLYVSTLEARKNHGLLLRVWRRFLKAHPFSEIPTLVFAGRVGWLVTDLMTQLDNADWLDGKIRLLADPTDQELHHLYRNCLFTVFPSFFEGWGLPVTESLSLGIPCIASGATSIPEAGGAFARYFDPDDASGAAEIVWEAISSPDFLRNWKKTIEMDYRPPEWERTVDFLLAESFSLSQRRD